MSTHLSGQKSVRLLHLGLDERMARFPHDRLASMERYLVIQPLRTLNLRDDYRSGMAFEYVA